MCVRASACICVCVCVCVCVLCVYVCVSTRSTAAFSGRVVPSAETQRGRRDRDITASPVTVNHSAESELSSIAYANRQLVGKSILSLRSRNRVQGKVANCSWQNGVHFHSEEFMGEMLVSRRYI